MENLPYGTFLMGAIAVAYIGVAVDLFRRGQYALAIVFGSYAVSNLGFVWIMKNG